MSDEEELVEQGIEQYNVMIRSSCNNHAHHTRYQQDVKNLVVHRRRNKCMSIRYSVFYDNLSLVFQPEYA